MANESISLTNLAPQIVTLQNNIRDKYAEANKTIKTGQTVIAGSSTVEIFPIEQLQTNVNLKHIIYNRGVRATTTSDLLEHIDTLIFDLAPSTLFLQIGANDLGFGYSEESMLENYATIIAKVHEKLPDTQIYIMAFYPIKTVDEFVDPRRDHEDHHNHPKIAQHRTNEMTTLANEHLESLSKKLNVNFINLNAGLTDENGNLKKELTFDGLHPLPAGYEIVFNNMQPYLN
ncbi:GDSL-type esterase/lipase family protein [Leuconostoc pseudomesenteroides]|uniref:GDSL-type esterase/lipase family protein n=1 Tax=Leuconostoc pseudomesenteroides TaxID=33968 RepID=UPI0021A56B74|nr:GDSL-type esterase/lipase family protein [Leuconostoc pseudomesenteroides]MCT4413730.1 lysophospholipase [Leuconostoc pseudomesenteroides]